MKNILYVGFFDFQDSTVPRNYTLACTNKMESIAEALIDAGYKVSIISSAVGVNDKKFFSRGQKIFKNKNLSASFMPTWGGTSLGLRMIRRFFSDIWLFWQLITKTRKNEPVIVYHSLGFRNVINLAKKIKKFKVILELEEIYQDVSAFSQNEKELEWNIINQADGYIFPTELLNKSVNYSNKPYAIILGTYHVDNKITDRFNDGKTHVVYAGTFDPRKGGAAAAAAAAAALPDCYKCHICGFGSPEETNELLKTIEQVNASSPHKIVYHGILKGNDYIMLLQKCHIGLSTQNPNASFNATSFPSKILSYMANGLDVVTVDIPAVRESSIGRYLYYYPVQTPEAIANAIAQVKTGKMDNRFIIENLYHIFVQDIKSLISQFE